MFKVVKYVPGTTWLLDVIVACDCGRVFQHQSGVADKYTWPKCTKCGDQQMIQMKGRQQAIKYYITKKQIVA